MISSNNSRGRPRGSEKDDSKALTAIADMIFASPNMKATAAMRRYNRDASDADVRRWQTKWKDRKDALLAEAKARAEERERKKAAQKSENSTRDISTIRAAALGSQLNSAAIRAALGLDLPPAFKAIVEHYNSPAMRIMREIQNDPAFRLAREMHNNPALRIAREQLEMLNNLKKLGGM